MPIKILVEIAKDQGSHVLNSLTPMRVCAAPAYLDAAGIPERLDDLSDHRAVLYGRRGHVRCWVFATKVGQPREIVPPSKMRFDDLGAVRDAAVAGQGLGWLPCWLIRDDVAEGRLATVLGPVPAYVFETHALWPQTPHLPLRVRLAIDALTAALPEATSMLDRTAP